jgi:P27 family predicted phage terminase small subunit
MKNSDPKPAKDLSAAAKRKFRSLQAEYDISDTAGLDLLNDYCQFYDRREQARKTIREDGAVIKDRFGQTVAHPATRIERDASGAMLKCLRALNLDLEPKHDKPGRPPGR